MPTMRNCLLVNYIFTSNRWVQVTKKDLEEMRITEDIIDNGIIYRELT